MSRGYDYGERDRPESETPGTQMPLFQGRGSGSSKAGQTNRARPKHARDSERFPHQRADARDEVRLAGRHYELSAREHAVVRDVGRFRTIATDDLLKHHYGGKTAAMRKELVRLQQHGLLQRRSISVGKNRNTLVIVALTREGARVARQDNKLPEYQAVYARFVKPAEVPHDAAIYRMYQAEVPQIEARGGQIRRVILDYELKREVYSKLARERDSGALQYARRQQEIAQENNLPIVDGKIVLPDLRIEYETSEGDLDRVDLELTTEHYHRGHMDLKARAGFKMYGFVSTSRGHRAQWEGRELTATVLSL